MRCVYIAVLVIFCCLWNSLISAELNPAAEKVLATIEWVDIPQGEFLMGSTQEEAETAYTDAKLRSSLLEKHTFDAEVPKHNVYLNAYQISRYEITNAQYRVFIEATGRPTPRGHQGEETWKDENFNADTQPVVGVTWFDAQAFAEWIAGVYQQKHSGNARLAAQKHEHIRGGTNHRKHDTMQISHAATTVQLLSDNFPNGTSPNGIADLAGNVWGVVP